MRERTNLDNGVSGLLAMESELSDTVELIELGEIEGDVEIVSEAEAQLGELCARASRLRLESMLSGEADGNNCYVEIHAGAGGTESQDWAEMLLRMYSRWSDQRDFKSELVEASAGEEAGLKSATLHVRGTDAYGWMKTESGVHRLVRISPFDSASRRHTSFASVWVYPEIDDDIEIKVLRKERIELPMGMVDTIVVEPLLKSEGVFRSRGTMNIWFTDDENLIPVMMRSKIFIGSIYASLREHEGCEINVIPYPEPVKK